MFDSLDHLHQIIFQNIDIYSRCKLRTTCKGFNDTTILSKIEKYKLIYITNNLLDSQSRGKLRIVSKLFNEPYIKKKYIDFDICFDKIKTAFYHTNRDFELIASDKISDINLLDYYDFVLYSGKLFMDKYNGYYDGIYKNWQRTHYS